MDSKRRWALALTIAALVGGYLLTRAPSEPEAAIRSTSEVAERRPARRRSGQVELAQADVPRQVGAPAPALIEPGDEVPSDWDPPVKPSVVDEPLAPSFDALPEGACGTDRVAEVEVDPTPLPPPGMRQPSDEAPELEHEDEATVADPAALFPAPTEQVLAAQRAYAERATQLEREGRSAAEIAQLKAAMLGD